MVCEYAPFSIFDNNNIGRNNNLISRNVLSPTLVLAPTPLSSSSTSMWSQSSTSGNQRLDKNSYHSIPLPHNNQQNTLTSHRLYQHDESFSAINPCDNNNLQSSIFPANFSHNVTYNVEVSPPSLTIRFHLPLMTN